MAELVVTGVVSEFLPLACGPLPAYLNRGDQNALYRRRDVTVHAHGKVTEHNAEVSVSAAKQKAMQACLLLGTSVNCSMLKLCLRAMQGVH